MRKRSCSAPGKLPATRTWTSSARSHPLGAAIVGHKEGDKLSYTAPNGKDITVEIISAKPYAG